MATTMPGLFMVEANVGNCGLLACIKKSWANKVRETANGIAKCARNSFAIPLPTGRFMQAWGQSEKASMLLYSGGVIGSGPSACRLREAYGSQGDWLSWDRTYLLRMPDADENLTPADPHDVETSLALALTSGRAMARSQAAETMSKDHRTSRPGIIFLAETITLECSVYPVGRANLMRRKPGFDRRCARTFRERR